jgi:hypothetical protein
MSEGRHQVIVVGGLAAFSLPGVGGLLALPIFALPVVLLGTPVNRGLVNAAILTLTYRLASYWAPLAAGPIAYGLFRIRYRSSRSTPQTAVAGT